MSIIDTGDPVLWLRGSLTAEGAGQLLALLSARPEVEAQLDAAMGKAGAARKALTERRRGVQGDDAERERVRELERVAYSRGASTETARQLVLLRDAIRERHLRLDAALAALAPPHAERAVAIDAPSEAPAKRTGWRRRSVQVALGGVVAIACLGAGASLLMQPRSGLDVFAQPWSQPADVPNQSILSLASSGLYMGGPLRYVGTLENIDYFAGIDLGTVTAVDVSETVCLYGVVRSLTPSGGATLAAECVDREVFEQAGVSISESSSLPEGNRPSAVWGPSDTLRSANG